MLIDPFGRHITTLRISLTSHCNLECRYCNTGRTRGEKDLPLSLIKDAVDSALSLGISRIKLTGGEPLVRNDIATIVSSIKDFSGIEDLSITTNGILLSRYAFSLKEAGLNRLNISLDCLDPALFARITGGGDIKKVLRGIDAAREAGLAPIKINCVLQEGINNNEIDGLTRFCKENGYVLQLINCMDLKTKKSRCENRGVTHKPPLCSMCNRIRLTSDGVLLPCLFSDRGINLSHYSDMKEALRHCVDLKPQNGERALTRSMIEIGG